MNHALAETWITIYLGGTFLQFMPRTLNRSLYTLTMPGEKALPSS